MKRFYFLIIALIGIGFNVNAQIITIAAARATAAGDTVTVTGIATNGAEFGYSRFIQDATGGIDLYGSIDSTIKRGDSVIAKGTISTYDSLTEIALTSVSVVSHNNALPVPPILTLTNGFTEQ
jgi:hypothetical protein